MSLPAGHRLGPYAIERSLGEGGMGQVFRARDTRLDRIVAIKILPQQLAADPQFRLRFEREARAIAALTHPHICTLYDVGHEDDIDFLVMEYLEGQTLAQRLSAGALPLDDALLIATEIGDALCHAHERDIVHRDLKPANIFLCSRSALHARPRDGAGADDLNRGRAGREAVVAKLLDFGLAKSPVRRQPPAGADEPTISVPAPLTLEGIIVGTVGYMSPEQASGGTIEAASDIFSFGVILYEMLMQRRPFARETAAETLAAIIRETPGPIAIAQPSELTAGLRKIVERCLAKDPAARPSGMRDVTTELEEMRRGSTRPREAAPILERRMITALTMDIGSRQDMAVDVSPERLKHALDRAVVELTALIRTEGGLVERSGGDAIHAVFGAPAAHVDDPLRAIRAAHACVQWAAGNRARIPCTVRAGIESGEAVVDLNPSGTGGRQVSVGACMTVAARLLQLADPGQILVGPICQQASSGEVELAELGDLELKGMGRVPVWRLVAIAATSARDRLPLVGRQEELDLLRFAYRRAGGGRSVLALVSGPPGQGKSRLLEEFVAALGNDARVLQARCRPAGEPGARNPLLALLVSKGCEAPEEQLAERLATLFVDPLERQRVLAALSHSAGLSSSPELAALPAAQSHDEIANGWLRYFSALSTERPIVVWIDDLHLADAELVRLLDRLTFGSAMPLLVIATARPEFQPQSGLRSGADRFFVTLDRLEPADAHRLAILASGTGTSPIERAEGNPLFVIELARARVPASSDVPVTLHGVIGARLDELSAADRELLERAAVVGETFSADDASLLSARDSREVAADLDRLCALGYLRRDQGGLRFHHALVRDVAYGRLTAGDRMHLHARFARDGVPPGDVEAVAHHLWGAVGPDDADWVWEGSDDLVPLRAHAREAHLAAARRCAGRCAFARAVATCRRAFRFATTPLDVAQAEQTLGDVCAASGDVDEGAIHFLRARDLYRSAGPAVPADLYPSFLEHAVYTSGMFRRPLDESLVATLLEEGEHMARRADDTSSLARIHALRAYRSHDTVELAEALRLADEVSDPAPLASLLLHAAILLTRVGEFDLAKRTYDRLDAVAVAAGSTDRQLEFRAILALNTGSLDEAARLAGQFMAANASRGAHLKTHAFREQCHVLLARGDWDALRDLDARIERLVAAHQDTAFCYAVTTVRAFALVARALEADVSGARARLPQVEEPLQAEPFERESVLALVYGVLGKREALRAMAEDVYRGGAPFWFFQRTYAVALTMLESWDALDAVLPALERVAARGSPYIVALLAALREEMAAAHGGATPAHAALRQLGYLGWSRLLAYRPSA